MNVKIWTILFYIEFFLPDSWHVGKKKNLYLLALLFGNQHFCYSFWANVNTTFYRKSLEKKTIACCILKFYFLLKIIHSFLPVRKWFILLKLFVKIIWLKAEYLTLMAAECHTLTAEIVNINVIQRLKGNNIVLISKYS
jgi:hypothetical protein